MNLDDITNDLLAEYKDWKTHESAKNEYKDQFFKAAEDEIKKKTLARKTIRVATATAKGAKAHAEQYFSKWVVIDIKPLGGPRFSVTLEENPKYLPFTYVNREMKMVFTKQLSEQAALVDDEAIREDDLEFWEEITYVPERQLKSLDELSSEQLSHLQDYMYRPAPKIVLAAPKKAKPEDLEEE